MNPDLKVFEDIGNKLLVDPALPEKEYFVVQVLKQLAKDFKSDEGALIFGGGTSLSTAFGIVQRFSEDIDLRFIPKPKSTTQIREKLTEFIKNMSGFQLAREPIQDSKKIIFKLSYPSSISSSNETALRPFVQVEIYFAEKLNFEPAIRKINSAYCIFSNQPPEIEMACVALEETAADKISSLLWRVGTDNYDRSDMRHLHDLARLRKKIIIDNIFKQVVRQVYDQDIATRMKSDQSLEQAVENVINILETHKNAYDKDYIKYVNDMSYDTDPLSFNAALSEFKIILSQIL